MKYSAPHLLLGAFALCAIAGAPRAQERTITYDLVNVWLRPDITYPGTTILSPMSGVIEWTYTVGDFENGTGEFTSISIPGWPATAPAIGWTVETGQVEVTMIQSWHNYGLDLIMRLAPGLSEFDAAPIDPINSIYHVEVGVSRQGHIVSGSLVPRCPEPELYGTGTAGSGGFVPAIAHSGGLPQIGNNTFTIEGSELLGGSLAIAAVAALDASVPALGVTILVDPPSAALVAVPTSGTPGTAGAGNAQVPLPIPAVPAMVGASFYCQLLGFDPGAPGGLLSATSGMSLIICP